MATTPGKRGRKALVDLEQLKALMRMKPTVEDCATFFEVDMSTIEKTIKREFGLKYSEFREQHMVHTRFSLIQKAIEKAKGGDNVMLIFCLKNLCGWKDKHEVNADDENGKPFKLAYDPSAPKKQ